MARKDPTDHYAALGVDRRATKDEIRAAYKQAALKFHPDKCASKRGLWHALLGGALRSGRSACCVAATHGGVAMREPAVGPRPEALSWQNLR